MREVMDGGETSSEGLAMTTYYRPCILADNQVSMLSANRDEADAACRPQQWPVSCSSFGSKLMKVPVVMRSYRFHTLAHILLWASLIAAFICVSAPRISRDVTKYSIHHISPFQSTNHFLYLATGVSGASEQLIALFDSLPSSKVILIVAREDDPPSTFLAETMAYLAWPHPLKIINITRLESELTATDPATVAAFVFCRVNRPSWLPQGEHFGKLLEVIPLGTVPQR